MLYRWWKNLQEQLTSINIVDSITSNVDFDFSGTLAVGKETYISKDAKLYGNIIIGDNCMIGTGVIIRGNVKISNNVRIGYGVEIKESIIDENTTIAHFVI